MIVAGLAAIVTEALLPPAAGAAVPVPHEVRNNRETSPTQINERSTKMSGVVLDNHNNRVPSMLPRNHRKSHLEFPGVRSKFHARRRMLVQTVCDVYGVTHPYDC